MAVSETYNVSSTLDNDVINGTRALKHSFSLANIILCSGNFIGNIIVLILICKRRLLGTSTNVFVFSIAMADSVCCAGAIPYNVVLFLNMDMSVYLCKSYFYFIFVSRAAVAYSVILLTTEKVFNIMKPSRLITAGRCMFFASLVWFFAASYNVWAVVFYTVDDTMPPYWTTEFIYLQNESSNGKVCFFSRRFQSLEFIFLTLDLVVLYVIPISVVFIQLFALSSKTHGTLRRRLKTYCFILKFVVMIFIVFLLCHGPFELATILYNIDALSSFGISTFYELATLGYYSRGIWNLIIYGYFKQYVCKKRRHNIRGCKTQLEMTNRTDNRGLPTQELRPNR